MNFIDRRISSNANLRAQIETLKKTGEQSRELIAQLEQAVISAARQGELSQLPHHPVAMRLSNTFNAQQALLNRAQNLIKGFPQPLLTSEERHALLYPDPLEDKK